MVNLLHLLEHERHGFGYLKRWLLKESEKLQKLLENIPTKNQRQLAEALYMLQVTNSRCLRARGKINKFCKLVPQVLNKRQQENHKISYEMMLQHHKKRYLYIELPWMTRNKLILKHKTEKVMALTLTSRCFNSKAKSLRQEDYKLSMYLKPSETVYIEPYRQQIINLYNALIEEHDNALSHSMKVILKSL